MADKPVIQVSDLLRLQQDSGMADPLVRERVGQIGRAHV